MYHQNRALEPTIDSVFVHKQLSKTSTCLRKFHFHKTKWDRECHQSCSKRPVSAVNAISVKHNLVICGWELTFRGSAIPYFCILRDDEKISVLKKACHMETSQRCKNRCCAKCSNIPATWAFITNTVVRENRERLLSLQPPMTIEGSHN